MKEIKNNKTNSFIEARSKASDLWGGIEHRIEWLGEWNGIDFINDSKSTDVESVYYTFETVNQPIIWLCGDTLENESLEALEKLVKYKVVSIFSFGNTENWTPVMKKWVDNFKSFQSLEEAFEYAVNSAEKGSAVLLSPGNSSYDLFRDYKDRGNAFKSLVNNLDE